MKPGRKRSLKILARLGGDQSNLDSGGGGDKKGMRNSRGVPVGKTQGGASFTPIKKGIRGWAQPSSSVGGGRYGSKKRTNSATGREILGLVRTARRS